MRIHVRSAERGTTLLEILLSLLLISGVALANGSMIRSLGLLGAVQFSPSRFERPARTRTLAMEYIQAELEYLQNWSYEHFRDAGACNPTNGLPYPISNLRRIPASYLNDDEPRLPPFFSAADVLITSEAVVAPASPPEDCRPRRMTINVYLSPGDLPPYPGATGGSVFARGETVFAPR